MCLEENDISLVLKWYLMTSEILSVVRYLVDRYSVHRSVNLAYR